MIPALLPLGKSQVLAALVGAVPANFNMLPDGKNFTPANSNPVQLHPGRTWRNEGSSVSAMTFVGPDGQVSAQKLIEDAANNPHATGGPTDNSNITAGAGLTINGGGAFASQAPMEQRFVLIARAVERTRVVLKIGNSDTIANTYATAGFDLSGGNTGYDNSLEGPGPWSAITTSMRSLGNGWWLCILDAINAASSIGIVNIFLDAGSGVAARNISYLGDGSSGVLVYFASWLPTAAWRIGAEAFFEDFNTIDNIDLNDTRASNFTWFTHNKWPNFNRGGQSIAVPTPSGYISVANSVLTLSNDASGFSSGISTAAAGISDPSTYIGRIFGPPPIIFEASIAFNGSTYPGPNFGAPTFWAFSKTLLTTLSPPPVEGSELDIMEAAFVIGIEHHTNTIDFLATDPLTNHGTSISFRVLPVDTSDFLRYACLVYSPASNEGANGGKMSFQEGIALEGGWDGWPATGAANFSVLNNDQWVLICGCGGGSVPWPAAYGWVRVFQ